MSKDRSIEAIKADIERVKEARRAAESDGFWASWDSPAIRDAGRRQEAAATSLRELEAELRRAERDQAYERRLAEQQRDREHTQATRASAVGGGMRVTDWIAVGIAAALPVVIIAMVAFYVFAVFGWMLAAIAGVTVLADRWLVSKTWQLRWWSRDMLILGVAFVPTTVWWVLTQNDVITTSGVTRVLVSLLFPAIGGVIIVYKHRHP